MANEFELDLSKHSKRARGFLLRVLRRMKPPVSLNLAQWAEANIVLPAGQSARPGAYRNWPYLTEILNSIGSSTVEYVTLMKPSRVGFTKGLMIAIAASASINPSPIGLLVPVDDDARDYVVDELEPLFRATPALRSLFIKGRMEGRNTITRKRFTTGATLKILSARAPRKLRRHDFKLLYCDEIDAMEITAEGDPLAIAEKRTFAHGDRKIVRGSTPTEEDISLIERSYGESDQRVFELQCPQCSEWFELLWEMIQWPKDEPKKALAFCPHCGAAIEESLKPGLVERGRWRVQRPEITNHHGYRLNALVSLLSNAAWGKLAEEFLRAKRGGPAEMQVFTNLVLGKTWKTSIGRLSAATLAGRVEPISLERIPEEVVLLTCGADVQDNRIEACVVGWPMRGAPCVLGHFVIDGNTLNAETWANFDLFLKRRWTHPNGWDMRIDACAIDSGGHEGRTQMVYDFCGSRLHRRVYAIRGVGGARPIWSRASKVKGSARLWIVGHDQVKTAVLELLAQEPFDTEGGANPHALRVSDELAPEWFDQVTGEVRRVTYVRNRPVIEFTPKRRGQRLEALDCLCYAWAVRHSPAVRALNLRARSERRQMVSTPEAGEANPAAPAARSKVNWAAHFNEG